MTTIRRLATLLALTALAWALSGFGPAHAEVRTISDGAPVLDGTDALKVTACAIAAVIGLVLCAWSLRPEREPVRVRARDDER